MAAQRLCSIPDCGKPLKATGFCSMHYARASKSGDPLVFKGTERGEPKEFYQNVVLNYEGDDCLSWPYSCVRGYGQLRVDGKTHLVSRLVCEDVHGTSPTLEHHAAHSCGRGHTGCVTKGHLSWKVRTDNEQDKIAHGTHNRGERSATAKITEAQAREILSLRGKEGQVSLASRFGISRATVSSIHIRKSWAWMDAV